MRILQIAHNHPKFSPGGTEMLALALHKHALAQGIDSYFLGAFDESQSLPNPGTNMVGVDRGNREALIFFRQFDRFFLSQPDTYGGLRELREYLDLLRPDVVHFHHFLHFGLEAFFVARSALPDAKLILTLHDFYLICANNGQLYKHDSGTRCDGPSMGDCVRCLPQLAATDFAMRSASIRNAISLFDHIVSPSQFLRDKVAPHLQFHSDIEVIENGYIGSSPAVEPAGTAPSGPVRFGYFGNISAVKGIADLLDAAIHLQNGKCTDFVVDVFGSQLFEDKKLQSRIDKAQAKLGPKLVFHGRYRPEDMPRALADVDAVVFPSVWWENAPLVIYEAMNAGKQVICYPHGGAPEILKRYGVGLFAERSNPSSLAKVMRKAIDEPGLLAARVSQPLPRIEALSAAYSRFYRGPKPEASRIKWK